MEKPLFPMRINKYLALKNYSTRRGADEIIKKGQVFINGKLAELGTKVKESDVVEVKFRGKPTPLSYFAYNKPRGVSTHGDQDEDKPKIKKGAASRSTGPAPKNEAVPIGGLDRESHGLVILSNDGRITDRLLSPDHFHEKEYVVAVKDRLRSSFKQKMEAGVRIENETTQKCKIKLIDENRFYIILNDEKRHQIRRMCVALFQEVKDIECIRIMNITLGNLGEGSRRKIEGDELKVFLESLKLL